MKTPADEIMESIYALGSSIFDLGKMAVTTGIEVAKQALPGVVMEATGIADKIRSMVGEVSTYRQNVHAKVLSLDSVLSKQIPPMTLSGDANIRSAGESLRIEATELRARGYDVYQVLVKSEGELTTLANNIIQNPTVLTQSQAVIERLLGEGQVNWQKGDDFINAFNAYIKKFQDMYNSVYQTSTASAAKEVITETYQELKEKISALPSWAIPAAIGGVILLFVMRRR
jgi:hypothetical protein